MKLLPMIAALCALFLCGCATLKQRDRDFLQQHGVAGPLYDKMLHEDEIEIPDIIELSQKGLPSRFIIHYLQRTYYVYHLTPGDEADLKKAGVSREVIDYLLATPGLYGHGYSHGPYPPYGPYAPYPPYPPYPPYDYPYGYYGPGYYGGGVIVYPGERWHRW